VAPNAAAAPSLALYLDSRHVFRRIYRADLEWAPMEHLVRRLPAVAAAWRGEIEAFLRFVEAVLRHAASCGPAVE
jgi:hypothetical protein